MSENIRWQCVNEEPFEYAIQQGPHGDEFVKLLDGTCLRRASSPAQEPVTTEPVRRSSCHPYGEGECAPPQPGRDEIARIIEARVLGGAAWEEPQASCYRAADAILALTGAPK